MDEQAELPLEAGSVERKRQLVDVNDLMAEVFKRHGVRMRRDDPSLMLVTAWELIARQTLAEFEVACERANDDTSALMAQHVERARGVAADVVDAAVQYQAQKMRQVVDELAPVLALKAAELISRLGQEVGSTRERTARSERRAWLAAVVGLVAAALTVGVMLGRTL